MKVSIPENGTIILPVSKLRKSTGLANVFGHHMYHSGWVGDVLYNKHPPNRNGLKLFPLMLRVQYQSTGRLCCQSLRQELPVNICFSSSLRQEGKARNYRILPRICPVFCPNLWGKNKDAHYVWIVLILYLYNFFLTFIYAYELKV
ncbi:hypothetical protein mRhiFer1_010216 [Rhinolophus ferrumequinum]|uniref:Uncharacterized protein n=1 Tax=Rhinolophus ferrumequinum TaxID=59479 RepID=A0A7J7X5L1_RHIFE|nr:hypothetical protein mRhiFer1_010216 [Rhinolophus ferrumequinum]